MSLCTLNDSQSPVTLVERNPTPLGVALVNPDKSHKIYNPSDIVELAQSVKKGDEFIRANACNKLSVIANQIKYLQEEAQKVLERAKRDQELHHAACNMTKKPGTIYHLYKRTTGSRVPHLSIVSPEEWGESLPHEYLGSYRLEYDQSWTPINEIRESDIEQALMNKILKGQLSLPSNVS